MNTAELAVPSAADGRSIQFNVARRIALRALAALVAFVLMPALHAQEMAAGGKAKVEALIAHIEGLKDVKFIRNGSEYDAKTAAKFLRGKWRANEKEIRTAADFIAIAATKSSTSGKPYLLRMKGGGETPCGDYLSALLGKMGAGNHREPPAPQPRPVIEFDREKLAALGITAAVASKAVEEFFQTHARFAPEKLRELVIKNEQGLSVRLLQVAVIKSPEQ